ncbi:MAG: GNAT family N-acetyltransferase, partial [Proteobacteria bacterium]|nr:GNAT family N-acetyltransferase [Pseudomonadota bacterium]
MLIRPFRAADAAEMGQLAAQCARGEADFVLNPLWETPDELFAEFERFGTDPESHLWVSDAEEEGVSGLVGFLRAADGTRAGLVCPIVRRQERGRGLGGELLREALAGGAKLGIELATAAVGTRNRAGYSLLTAYG